MNIVDFMDERSLQNTLYSCKHLYLCITHPDTKCINARLNLFQMDKQMMRKMVRGFVNNGNFIMNYVRPLCPNLREIELASLDWLNHNWDLNFVKDYKFIYKGRDGEFPMVTKRMREMLKHANIKFYGARVMNVDSVYLKYRHKFHGTHIMDYKLYHATMDTPDYSIEFVTVNNPKYYNYDILKKCHNLKKITINTDDPDDVKMPPIDKKLINIVKGSQVHYCY